MKIHRSVSGLLTVSRTAVDHDLRNLCDGSQANELSSRD